MRDRSAELLRQGGAQRRNDQHAALGRKRRPRTQEFALLLQSHRSMAATTPLRLQFRRVRQTPAHFGLVSGHACAAHTEHRRRLLERRVQQRRQQHSLRAAQLVGRLSLSRQPLGMLDNPHVHLSWSRHTCPSRW